MNHPPVNLDLEISSAEIRIEYHKRRLRENAAMLRTALRATLASPGMLLAATGTGYLLGSLSKADRPDRPSPARRLWEVITDALRVVLKLSQTGPVVWLATTIGASRAVQKQPQQPEPRQPAAAAAFDSL